MKNLGLITHRAFVCLLSVALVLCLCMGALSFTPTRAADEETAAEQQTEIPAAYTYRIGDKSVPSDTEYIMVSETEYRYSDFEAGYNAAVSMAKELQNKENPYVKVVLADNWTAEVREQYGAPSFGSGAGFLLDRIYVPDGAHIMLDLNGFVVDRAAAQTAINGNVVYVQGELMLFDSNPEVEHPDLLYGGTLIYEVDPDDYSNYIPTWYDRIALKGGAITGGNAYYGGGIYVAERGKLSVYGGTVFNNVAMFDGGGIALMAFVEFNMYGGAVVSNTAYGNGGGVLFGIDTVAIYGGEISYNTSIKGDGGGIYADAPIEYNVGDVYWGVEFVIYDVRIFKNSAYGNGGGICFTSSEFHMQGGEIYENEANWYGGGIYGNEVLWVEGAVKVYDNTGRRKNIDFGEDGYIYVSGNLVENETLLTLSNPAIFVSGYDVKNFSDSSRSINLDENGKPLNPELFFKLDFCTYTGEYHIVREASSAGVNQTQDYSSLRISKYYVEWYVNDMQDIDTVDYSKELAGPYDNVLYFNFYITDYGKKEFNYRSGISAKVYTLNRNGVQVYANSGSAVKAKVYRPGYMSYSDYAPVTDNGIAISSDRYIARASFGGEDFDVILDIEAQPITDDVFMVAVEAKDASAFVYQYASVSNKLDQQIPKWSELFTVAVTVQRGEETVILKAGEDYTVDDLGRLQVSEEGNLVVRGINAYSGEFKYPFSLTTNTSVSYAFTGWQFDGANIAGSAHTVTYDGTDLAERTRMALTVEGLNLGLNDYSQYGYVVYKNNPTSTDKGLSFHIYKSTGDAWETVESIVNVGTYKIVFDEEDSKPNADISQIDCGDLILTVVEKEVDFSNAQVDGVSASADRAVRVTYYDGYLETYVAVAFLTDNAAYYDGEKVAYINGNEGAKFVYYNENEFVLALSGLFLDGIDVAAEIENGTCVPTITNSTTDTVGGQMTVTEITSSISLLFMNYIDNGSHETSFEFNWKIVTACNGIVDANGDAYDLDLKSIEYGSSEGLTVPRTQYGYGALIITLGKDGGDSRTFAVTNLQSGATVLNEYAEGKLGAEIESSFADYVASVIVELGAGKYTLSVDAETYTDAEGVRYYAITQDCSFTVVPRAISPTDALFSAIVISDDIRYTGRAITPAMLVTFNRFPLTSGTDYTVSFSNNIGAGVGKATVTGLGNFTGSFAVDFEIKPANDNEWTTLRISGWWFNSFNPLTNVIIASSRYGYETAVYSIEQFISDGESTNKLEGLSDIRLDETGAFSPKVAELLNLLPHGRYALVATTEENPNYNVATAVYSFEVYATSNVVPTLTLITSGSGQNNIYTGNTLSIAIKDFNSAVMTIEIDERLERFDATLYAVNAGEYTVKFTLKDTENSAWDDGEGGLERVITWVIEKQKVAVPDYGENTFMITGDLITYLPEGFDADLMEISGNSATAAGQYDALISLKDPENYEWANPDYGDVITRTYTIQSSMRLFIILMSVLCALIFVTGAIAIAQYVQHKQRLKIFEMAANEAQNQNGQNAGQNAEGGNEQ